MPFCHDLRLAIRSLNRVRMLWVTFAACAICPLIARQPASAADLVLVHARVYASPGVLPVDDATIVLRDGRIASVSRTGSVASGGQITFRHPARDIAAFSWVRYTIRGGKVIFGKTPAGEAK
jgi:hypothetical protein